MKVKAYTDGACSGNPGPGGWGVYLVAENNCGEIIKEETLYGKNKEVFSGCTRDYIHVSDVVNAFLRCLDRPLRNNHQILNICSNKGYRVEEIVALTEALSEKKTRTILRQLPKNESYILVGNNKKARHALGWVPTKSIEDLIQSAWVYQTRQDYGMPTM